MSVIFRTRTSSTQYIKLERNKKGMSQPCQRLLTVTEYVCRFSQWRTIEYFVEATMSLKKSTKRGI